MTGQNVLSDGSVCSWINNSCIISSSVYLVRHDSIVNNLAGLNLIDEIIVKLLVIIVVREVIEYMSAADAYFCIN
jgi:hypothetical protein